MTTVIKTAAETVKVIEISFILFVTYSLKLWRDGFVSGVKTQKSYDTTDQSPPEGSHDSFAINIIH